MLWILTLAKTLTTAAFLVPLLSRVAVALGVTVLSYVGFNALFEGLQDYVVDHYAGLAPDILQVLGLADFDKGLSVILSAYSARITMLGLDATGSLKRVIMRPGQTGSLF